MAVKVQHIGLVPFISPRATYDTTGVAISFRVAGVPNPILSAHVTLYVYRGTALVALDGEVAGPFIELVVGQSFDFPVATQAVYIKSKAGTADVGLVASLNPIEKGV